MADLHELYNDCFSSSTKTAGFAVDMFIDLLSHAPESAVGSSFLHSCDYLLDMHHLSAELLFKSSAGQSRTWLPSRLFILVFGARARVHYVTENQLLEVFRWILVAAKDIPRSHWSQIFSCVAFMCAMHCRKEMGSKLQRKVLNPWEKYTTGFQTDAAPSPRSSSWFARFCVDVLDICLRPNRGSTSKPPFLPRNIVFDHEQDHVIAVLDCLADSVRVAPYARAQLLDSIDYLASREVGMLVLWQIFASGDGYSKIEGTCLDRDTCKKGLVLIKNIICNHLGERRLFDSVVGFASVLAQSDTAKDHVITFLSALTVRLAFLRPAWAVDAVLLWSHVASEVQAAAAAALTRSLLLRDRLAAFQELMCRALSCSDAKAALLWASIARASIAVNRGLAFAEAVGIVLDLENCRNGTRLWIVLQQALSRALDACAGRSDESAAVLAAFRAVADLMCNPGGLFVEQELLCKLLTIKETKDRFYERLEADFSANSGDMSASSIVWAEHIAALREKRRISDRIIRFENELWEDSSRKMRTEMLMPSVVASVLRLSTMSEEPRSSLARLRTYYGLAQPRPWCVGSDSKPAGLTGPCSATSLELFMSSCMVHDKRVCPGLASVLAVRILGVRHQSSSVEDTDVLAHWLQDLAGLPVPCDFCSQSRGESAKRRTLVAPAAVGLGVCIALCSSQWSPVYTECLSGFVRAVLCGKKGHEAAVLGFMQAVEAKNFEVGDSRSYMCLRCGSLVQSAGSFDACYADVTDEVGVLSAKIMSESVRSDALLSPGVGLIARFLLKGDDLAVLACDFLYSSIVHEGLRMRSNVSILRCCSACDEESSCALQLSVAAGKSHATDSAKKADGDKATAVVASLFRLLVSCGVRGFFPLPASLAVRCLTAVLAKAVAGCDPQTEMLPSDASVSAVSTAARMAAEAAVELELSPSRLVDRSAWYGLLSSTVSFVASEEEREFTEGGEESDAGASTETASDSSVEDTEEERAGLAPNLDGFLLERIALADYMESDVIRICLAQSSPDFLSRLVTLLCDEVAGTLSSTTPQPGIVYSLNMLSVFYALCRAHQLNENEASAASGGSAPLLSLLGNHRWFAHSSRKRALGPALCMRVWTATEHALEAARSVEGSATPRLRAAVATVLAMVVQATAYQQSPQCRIGLYLPASSKVQTGLASACRRARRWLASLPALSSSQQCGCDFDLVKCIEGGIAAVDAVLQEGLGEGEVIDLGAESSEEEHAAGRRGRKRGRKRATGTPRDATASARKRRRGSGRQRSKNEFVDAFLSEESGDDAFSDLEDFVVCD